MYNIKEEVTMSIIALEIAIARDSRQNAYCYAILNSIEKSEINR